MPEIDHSALPTSEPNPGLLTELGGFIEKAVARGIATAQAPPELVNIPGLAHALSCSPTQVKRLMKQGMPFCRLGNPTGGDPRFDVAECVAWLRNRKPEPTQGAAEGGSTGGR